MRSIGSQMKFFCRGKDNKRNERKLRNSSPPALRYKHQFDAFLEPFHFSAVVKTEIYEFHVNFSRLYSMKYYCYRK